MEDSSAQEIQNALNALARRIVELRLESFASFFLEAHKPLGGLAYNGALFLEPFITPKLSGFPLMSEVLQDSRNVDFLLEAIDRHAEVRSAKQPEQA